MMTKDNTAQKASPAYRLAALDPDFLLNDSMRGVRLHLEYQKAEGILRAWTVRLLADDHQLGAKLAARIAEQAPTEPSVQVRSQWASSAKRVSAAEGSIVR